MRGFLLFEDSESTGRDVSGAGDLNGDGFDDISFTNWIYEKRVRDNIAYRERSSQAYIVFGGDTPSETLEFETYNRGYGAYRDPIRLKGKLEQVSELDATVRSITPIGDFDGDGYADLFIEMEPEGIEDRNAVSFPSRILYGGSDFATTLAGVTRDRVGPSETEFINPPVHRISDRAAVRSVGDLNGDGLDDILLDRDRIIYGRTGRGQSIDLGATDGSGGTILTNTVSDRPLTYAIGDINGDGFSDLAQFLHGSTGIVLGNNDNLGPIWDVGNAPTLSGALFTSRIGDIDGDGIDDLALRPYSTSNSSIQVLYGEASLGTKTIDISKLSPQQGFLIELNRHRSIASGDANGDGLNDLIITTSDTSGSGEGPDLTNLIYGHDFRADPDYQQANIGDIITVLPGDHVIRAGSGNDVFNVTGGGHQQISTGGGEDRVRYRGFGSVSASGTPPLIDLRTSGISGYQVSFEAGLSGSAVSAHLRANGNDASASLEAGLPYYGNDIRLGLGSLLIQVGDDLAIHLDSFDPDNARTSPRDIDSLTFSDGVSLNYDQLLDLGFDLDGTDQADVITGTSVTDRINGLAGDDSLSAGDGNDTLNGGTGTDQLNGGLGDDLYIINRGDGHDRITDAGGNDRLLFGSGLVFNDLRFDQQGDDLHINIGALDQLHINGWYANPKQRIETLAFADGAEYSADEVSGNLRPQLNQPTADQQADADTPWALTLAEDASIKGNNGGAHRLGGNAEALAA